MPLPTSNPGALITIVGGVHASRIALYVNSIAALQVRTAARQGAWWWETCARKFMSSGSNTVKDGRLVVVISVKLWKDLSQNDVADATPNWKSFALIVASPRPCANIFSKPERRGGGSSRGHPPWLRLFNPQNAFVH